jgi:MFS transporter, FHS family, glucose/mannose:H+ symporter
MALGMAAFLYLGGIQAAYGPSFAALQARFGVGLGEVGGSVGAHFLGGFVGVMASGLLLARFGYRPLLVAASLLVAAGAATVAFAPAWGVALLGALVIGLGYGHSVVLYNFLFARAFAPRGAAAVNLINGGFGIGAVLVPALVGWTTALRLARAPDGIASVTPLVFGAIALVGVALALAVLRAPGLPGAASGPGPRRGGRAPVAAAALFAALMFVYVAAEVGTSAWAPTHVAGQVGAARGALAASVFWIAMTVGRFGAAALAGRWRSRDLVLGAAALGTAGLLVAALPGLALVGYALAGVALGPVFPTTVVWVQQRFGARAEQVGSLVLAAGNLGPVVGAPAIGVAVAAIGTEAIPLVLAAVAGALLALVAAAWRGDRHPAG